MIKWTCYVHTTADRRETNKAGSIKKKYQDFSTLLIAKLNLVKQMKFVASSVEKIFIFFH
jgi:hypothetical protein